MRVVFLILLLINILAFVPIPLVSTTSEGTLFTDFSYPYPTDDSWIELSHPDRNYGRGKIIHVRTDSTTVRRTYLKFDLSAITTDKVIVSAKLYLYCVAADPPGNVQMNVHKTEDNWDEHTITWNNAPPVGTFVASNASVDGTGKFYSWDITSYAQSEFNDDKLLSVVVKFPVDDPAHPELNPYKHRDFASKETPKSSRRPYLKISYTEPTLSVSITPTSVVMDVSQSQTFTSTVSGGTPPYLYQWYLNGTAVLGASDPTWTFTPDSAGFYTVFLNVTDNLGLTAKSNIASATVNPALTVSISPTSAILDVGQPQLFTSTVSDGTPPYTYQWYLNDTPVSGATSSDWTFTPESSGSYLVHVNVTDYVGVTAKSNIASVTVNPELSVSISPTLVTMNLDDSKTFTSSVSGGTSPHTYQWYLDGVPVSDATDPTWTFTPTATGSYTVRLNVTDSVGVTAQSNPATVWVNPPLVVSISPSSVVMDVGQSQLFTSTVSDGTPLYTYQWYLDDTPVPGATDPTWTFTPSSPGLYEVYLEVTDSVCVTVKSNIASITVNSPPSVFIIPTSVTMDVGQSQLFTSTVSNGTPPYTYQWYLNGTPVPDAMSDSWLFTPDSAGYYLIYVRVTDYVGVSADSNTASVTVRGRPKADFTYQPLFPYVNETVTFNASASTPNGGVISNYTWNFGDGNITTVTNPIITHVYDEPGDYTVTLTVMDSEGLSDSTFEIITVYLPLLYSMDHTAHHLDEEFLINIVVANVTNLYSFELKLGYNTTLLDAINVTEGPFLKSFGSTSATIEIQDSEGYVWISVTLLGPAPPAEPRSGILATIKFKVTYATVYPETVGCSLDLYDTELNDPAGQPIPHTIHDGSYEFVPSPPPPCIGPAIDIYTQRSGHGPNMPSDAFGPQEVVILCAYISYNCDPLCNWPVAFEVIDPNGETFLYRSELCDDNGIACISFRIPNSPIFGDWTAYATSKICNQTVIDTLIFKVGWLIEITQVETVDINGNTKTSFIKGEHIYFNITVRNIAFTSKIATCTLVVYDECGVPIGHVVLHDWSISPGITQFFIIDLQIPKWAYVGVGTSYANAYTELPQLHGTPYCPEISIAFMITKP